MEAWCGKDMDWAKPWNSPCVMETGSSALLFLVTLIVFAVQRSRLSALHRQVLGSGAVFKQGMTGGEGLIAGFSLFVAALHACHVGASIASASYNYPRLLFNSLCLMSWLAVFALNWSSSSIHANLDCRPVFITGVLLYICNIYSNGLQYAASPRSAGLYLKFELWSGVLQFLMVTVLMIVDVQRHAKSQPPEGYAALSDAEQGEDRKVKRTWLKLFWSACKYVWPTSIGLQVRVLLCMLLLVFMRVVNIAVPIILKGMTDHFVWAETAAEGGVVLRMKDVVLPWVVLYLLAIFFQGGMGGGVVGLMNNLRQFLWIPVGQDTFYRISKNVFEHVLDLDLDFHIKRKTGEVTKVVDRGTGAIQNILSTILFSIGPQIVDVLVASTYLATKLNPLIAIIVFATVASYMPLTILVTEWRGGIRRDMNNAENRRSARVTDALLNYETIKYHNNERYETDAYVREVKDYQGAEFRFTASLNVLNVVQSAVMFAGVSSGLLVLCSELGKGMVTVGDTTMFLALMTQLYAPLNFFGTYYRIIQQYFIDMENLFDLMDKKPTVADKPGAVPLVLSSGEVEFSKVCFAYDPNRMVVRDLSFRAAGGSTVAFVGATGSGKSTITRLLFRFYDARSGTICIDKQYITDVTLNSLHTAIGLVPQDCVLFNDTIKHNIKYGRLAATDGEVEAAADAACIHSTISSRFPKGYDTLVGERGMRLSGGEKQRVAFARALLKNAPILVLDEATSALDSITEKKIQTALKSFRTGRTTLIVAHRLSTIMDADLICVMRDGSIVEQGKHTDLVEANGLYAQMWSKQLTQDDSEPVTGSEAESSSTVAAT